MGSTRAIMLFFFFSVSLLRLDVRHADGTLHEANLQCYDIHEKMRSAWPREEHAPGYRWKPCTA